MTMVCVAPSMYANMTYFFFCRVITVKSITQLNSQSFKAQICSSSSVSVFVIKSDSIINAKPFLRGVLKPLRASS